MKVMGNLLLMAVDIDQVIFNGRKVVPNEQHAVNQRTKGIVKEVLRHGRRRVVVGRCRGRRVGSTRGRGGSTARSRGVPATLILRSTGIEPRFEFKALHHEGEQVIPTGKDHIPH